MSNCTSLSSPVDIQAMLDDIFPTASSLFVSPMHASCPSGSTSIFADFKWVLTFDNEERLKTNKEKDPIVFTKHYTAILHGISDIVTLCCEYMGY